MSLILLSFFWKPNHMTKAIPSLPVNTTLFLWHVDKQQLLGHDKLFYV